MTIHWSRTVGLLLVSLAATAIHGCAASCEERIDRAVAFLESHQACEADEDCVVVRDFCETLPGGYCGQLTMNRAGVESAEWKSIAEELDECAPDQCVQCLGTVIPTCKAGLCAGCFNICIDS